ncbi:MAG: thioredoxin family protein [Cyclobacteriaceae bacterium]|jgi:hypothetical protein|nr:thioredoxin family protein [Cyclobacteriaceae bacterium]
MNHSVISPHVFDQAYSYTSYRQQLDRLMAQNKTTGPTQTDELVHYARLNIQRMNRLDKQVTLTEELRTALMALSASSVWLVITEGWCGDAAQNLPVIAKMAEAQPRIDLKLILRDEHPAIMDRYLFHGTRSIPRLVVIDSATHQDLAVWGPRPSEAQDLVWQLKDSGQPHEVWVEKVHAWYAANKTMALQHELTELIRSLPA